MRVLIFVAPVTGGVMRFRSIVCGLVAWTTVLTSSLLATPVYAANPSPGDPKGRDSILDWNAVALAAVAEDFSGTYGRPDQPGPTHTSRALAIIHVAMFDAANAVVPTADPYLNLKLHPAKNTSLDAAVATAAVDTLTALYPKQAKVFAAALQKYLKPIGSEPHKNGVAIGHKVASKLLQVRADDGSTIAGTYTPTGQVGTHDVDPLNPGQGFLDPAWGSVEPFALDANFHFVPRLSPALGSHEYTEAFHDVKRLGGDGVITSTSRTVEQTEIGLYWGYDGAPHLGVPPRLYNQIVRVIARQEHNTELENARLFALINIAQADAGIACWGVKYHDVLWRPVLGIRHANMDGNIDTVVDSTWTPLGSQASNTIGGKSFTPNFPSYTSGHATFGAATFRVLQRFYETDHICFTFVSDELNGITTDSQGHVRPLRPRTFHSFSQAALENARSRIYLGIHWQFDADEGVRCGYAVGDHAFDTLLRRHDDDHGDHRN